MTEYFDPRETRSDDARASDQLERLKGLIAHARAAAPHYRRALSDADPERMADLDALAGLPVLRKSDLIAAQEADPPFAGLATGAPGEMARLFLSPGPIAEAQGRSVRGDHWRFARALFAAGFRAGDVTHNCFSYHLTPAGMMFDAAARALGCAVFPGGVGAVEQQVAAMRRFGPTGWTGTPDFLKIILEKADSDGGPRVESIRKALVSAGPLFPDLRAWYEDRGIRTRQCYATADLGLIAYETDALEGMVVDEDAIVEIVRPGTGDPVAQGEVGEVVVTIFDPDYPLIRYATGDLSAVMPGQSPCGRTNLRLKGWMGRADQTTKVRGMFVHPEQVARVVKAHPEILRARCEVTAQEGRDTLRVICETETPDAALAARVSESFRAECRVRGDVEFAAPGALPNDGKVIADLRGA